MVSNCRAGGKIDFIPQQIFFGFVQLLMCLLNPTHLLAPPLLFSKRSRTPFSTHPNCVCRDSSSAGINLTLEYPFTENSSPYFPQFLIFPFFRPQGLELIEGYLPPHPRRQSCNGGDPPPTFSLLTPLPLDRDRLICPRDPSGVKGGISSFPISMAFPFPPSKSFRPLFGQTTHSFPKDQAKTGSLFSSSLS